MSINKNTILKSFHSYTVKMANNSTVIEMGQTKEEVYSYKIGEEEAARTRREWFSMIFLGAVYLAYPIYYWINSYI